MTPRIRLAAAAAILLIAGTVTYAEPVPTPVTPKPSGPMPVPYPDTPPPEPCPLVCLPKPATLQLAGGASTIEVESFSWGAASAGDGPTTVNTSDPQEGGEVAGRPVYTSDPQEGGEFTSAGRKAGGTKPETIERATSREGSPQSVMPQHEVTSPRDPASGFPTGKRMHKPMTMRQGSVEITMAEGVCVAGAHYPTVTLRSGDQSYEMRDVTVASCTPVATAKGKKDKAKLNYMVVTMETVLISG